MYIWQFYWIVPSLYNKQITVANCYSWLTSLSSLSRFWCRFLYFLSIILLKDSFTVSRMGCHRLPHSFSPNFTQSHTEYDRNFTQVVLSVTDAQSSHQCRAYQSTQEQGGAECECAVLNGCLTERESREVQNVSVQCLMAVWLRERAERCRMWVCSA